MANNPNNYLIAGNDEHGINPPTPGKRTPVMPFVSRSFYENEFNKPAKDFFLEACLRIGFNVFDVKPGDADTPINVRVASVNAVNPDALITFAYNAYGSGTAFNSINGIETYYSVRNPKAAQSRELAVLLFNTAVKNTGSRGNGVFQLDIGMLSSVICPAALIEAGYMTNFNEAKLMMDPDRQRQIGEAGCEAVCQFLNVPYTTFYNVATYPLQRLGSRGNHTKLLQYMLINSGYPVVPDGIFGPATDRAVRAYQSENGLAADGLVGRLTWTSLAEGFDNPPTRRQGDRGKYVYYMQRKLYSKLYPLGMDRIFGNDTARIVREFQSENELVDDGIVGQRTWEKLIPLSGGRTF